MAKSRKISKTPGRKASRPAPGAVRSSRGGERKAGSIPARVTKTPGRKASRPAPGAVRSSRGGERKAGSIPARVTRPRPSEHSLSALDRIQDILQRELGGRVTLQMQTPEPGRGRTPWAVLARLGGFNASYADMQRAVQIIEANRSIERGIGERTYARISVVYNGAKTSGRRGRTQREWTVGEIAPWGVTSARAGQALRVAKKKYSEENQPAGASRAVGLRIWLSTDKARDFFDEGDE